MACSNGDAPDKPWHPCHPASVFTVGYFIFMYERWGPRYVCTSVTCMGVCSRAEIFFLLFSFVLLVCYCSVPVCSVRIFTVGYFIFMYEQWGPRHVCTSVNRMGVCSRAEICFPFVFFCSISVLISLFCSALFCMGECRFCFSLVVYSNDVILVKVCFHYLYWSKCLLSHDVV